MPVTRPAAPRGMQVITASGDFTVPARVTAITVKATGGGAGGHNYGGGGAGGTAIKRITGLVPGAVIACAIGAGGAAYTNGGDTTFGAYCTGGGGKAATVENTGGEGGTATGGDLNIKGGGSQSATNFDDVGFSGAGGNSVWGGGGRGGTRFEVDVSMRGATNTGGGGAGGPNVGGSGVIVVEW